MSCGYWYATRKSDAQGIQRVSCCRTVGANLADFHLLGPVVDPYGVTYEDNIGA